MKLFHIKLMTMIKSLGNDFIYEKLMKHSRNDLSFAIKLKRFSQFEVTAFKLLCHVLSVCKE